MLLSAAHQDLELQTDALTKAGCEKIFSDKASGTVADRPGLAEAQAFAREGGSLVVCKRDRLGRSMKGLVDLAVALEGRRIDLRSLTDGIDTKGAAGRFFFNVMAALAVMERELILERTNGLAAARLAGKVGGRRPSMPPSKFEAARKMLNAGQAPTEVASVVGVSLATFYRYLPAGERRQT